jgi:hypothetical protein
MAVQAALGDRPSINTVHLNIDLTFNAFVWRSTDGQYTLPFYFGLGGVLAHSFASGERVANTEVGVRAPVGMSVLIRDNPIELFFEIAPELTIRNPASLGRYTIYSDGAIGFRYYL